MKPTTRSRTGASGSGFSAIHRGRPSFAAVVQRSIRRVDVGGPLGQLGGIDEIGVRLQPALQMTPCAGFGVLDPGRPDLWSALRQ